MSGLGIEIRVKDGATGTVANLRAGLQPAQVNPIVGRSARNTYREHLFGLNNQRANALGGPRTNFYASAARGTQFRVQGSEVIVSINQVGIALRYFGGTVRPRTKKYLTIPAVPEAHGKRASEFPGLHFAFELHPKFHVLMPCLVQGAASLLGLRRSKGTVRARFIGERHRRVIFWLVKSATFQADDTVLPHPELVEAQAVRALGDYVKLLMQRRTTGGPN